MPKMFNIFRENEILIDLFSTDTLRHLLRAAVYLLVGLLMIRLIIFIVRRISSRNVSKQSRMVVNKTITYTGITILMVIVLAELGVNLTALLGAAGIVGLAVGVASQKSLGNIVSGIFLLSEKSFEVGDAIKVGDKLGIVQDVDLLSVKIRTFDNLLIRIPNETLISTEVTNITRYPLRRMEFDFTVSLEDNLKTVEEVLRAMASEIPLVLDEPSPLFLLNSFGDSGLNLRFGVWFMKEDYLAVRNSVFRGIVESLKEAGIVIVFQQITVHGGAGLGNNPPAADKPDQENP